MNPLLPQALYYLVYVLDMGSPRGLRLVGLAPSSYIDSVLGAPATLSSMMWSRATRSTSLTNSIRSSLSSRLVDARAVSAIFAKPAEPAVSCQRMSSISRF